MLPSRHVLVSLPLAVGVGTFTESLLAGLLCFIAGVLIDVDHFLEYVIHFGFRDFQPIKVYRACGKLVKREGEGGIKKVYLFLHTGEMAIVLWVSFALTGNIYLLAIALGYTAHMIMDASANILRPEAYFIISRIRNGFKSVRLIRNNLDYR